MKNKIYLLVSVCLAFAGTKLIAGPSEADVGDPDSFRHNALYLGASSGAVYLRSDCSVITPDLGQCYTLNAAPNETDFDDEDVCQIKLPKGSTKDIIYPVVSFFHNYVFQNSTGSPQQAFFLYTASITIDSAALNDPTCTDPNTGNPCNGHLVLQYSDNLFSEGHPINNGEHFSNTHNYSHVGNLGITKRSLVESGIPQSVADKLFQGEMTLHLTIQGNAIMVSSGRITGNMRLFGD